MIVARANTYLQLTRDPADPPDPDEYELQNDNSFAACEALLQMDAAVMRAYSLPVQIERDVLDIFRLRSAHKEERRRKGVGCLFGDYYPADFASLVPLHEFISAGRTQPPEELTIHADHIAEARYVRPSQLYLRFADGLEGTWTFDQLDLDMSSMKLTTVKASSAGAFIEVQSKGSEDIQLDSASLRYRVDGKYAEKIDQSIRDLHITPAEAEEMSKRSIQTRDPRWYDVGDETDLLD